MAWNCPACGEVNIPDYMWRCTCGYKPGDSLVENTNLPPGHIFSAELPLEFRGSAREYFRIWIVNICLTLLTFGVYSAWAKVRKKRYFYSHTIIDKTPFQYLGQPIPILKGRVLAAIAFSAYYAASHFFTSLLPYVLIAGTVLAPWVVVRSASFNTRYSAFRNMTFHFDGEYMDALKVIYVGGLIPAIAVGMAFNWWGQETLSAIPFAIFGLTFPWWIKRLKNFIISRTSYGGQKGEFGATGKQFFKVYFRAGLIFFVVGIITIIFAALMFSFTKKSPAWVMLLTVPVYIGYVLSYAYVQAHISNLVWDHTQLGPLRFQSSLSFSGMVKLYLTNALGIIASLGLLTPWAVMRTLKYRADHLRVLVRDELACFQGSATDSVQATGAEMGDFFDMDISL